MNKFLNHLKPLGLNDWFQSRINADLLKDHEIARVIAVHRDSYLVSKGNKEVFAELAGKLIYSTDSKGDLPTTGDWVYVDFYDDDNLAIIHQVMPRKTLLKRKSAGNASDVQMISANIDTAFIIQSVDFNFNLRRLERYLAMVRQNNIKPIILLSKCDLMPKQELDHLIETTIEISAQTLVLPFSNQSGFNIAAIIKLLLRGQTYCLLGSSGVGKTTLLNRIMGSDVFETQSVSKKHHKGRHTTTSRELVMLDSGAMLIDTPGMRELGNLSVNAGIEETFSEISELSSQCKFSNCKHIKEIGCAILKAIDEGRLSKKRYLNYVKMNNEATFNDMSYIEKKRKDKNLGKMIKSALKNKSR